MTSFLSPGVRKFLVFFFSLLILVEFSACNYFKVQRLTNGQLPTVQELGALYNYFLIHDQDKRYRLSAIGIDSTGLSGTLTFTDRPVYYTAERGKRYKKPEEGSIVNEVHIYLAPASDTLALGDAAIPYSDISEIHIIDHNSGATTASYIFGTIGVLLGALTVLTIIVLLTKSSCPYVYANNGEAFLFEGEIFGGAIARNLERPDYLPLPDLKVVDGTYQLRISNELKERQFTDFADLVVVNHPENTEVLLDKSGNPHSFRDMIPPASAIASNGTAIESVLSADDQMIHFFNELDHDINEVQLTFPKPQGAQQGKLLLSAKNTFWGEYLFGEFSKKFGTFYDTWMDRQKELPAEVRVQTMVDHHFPLSAYLKKGDTWELIDFLPTVGPLAYRDFVLPVDLSGIEGPQVEIKLETGFMFWELDRAAMDFSEDQVEAVQVLKPSEVISNDGRDWSTALAREDGVYMEQPQVGNLTELSYEEALCPENQTQSFFLHTKGYYEPIRAYEGLPDISALKKFRQTGYFAQYSQEEYRRFITREDESLMVSGLSHTAN